MTALRAISGFILLVFLGGCATDGASLPSVSCGVFHPLTYSRHNDTKQTVKGIVGHNAAYKSLCGK